MEHGPVVTFDVKYPIFTKIGKNAKMGLFSRSNFFGP